MNVQIDFGPLASLIEDDSVTEILVDGYDRVYVERDGQLEDVPSPFYGEGHVVEVIDTILTALGAKVDESQPWGDVYLPDGSRVNVVIPPISLGGPLLTIRKSSQMRWTFEDLIRVGAVSADMVGFLQACVRARLNMVIAGGAGSGKTTLLQLAAGAIPADERIVVIVNALGLQLPESLRRVVQLSSKASATGDGEVTVQELVVNSLLMRPDRIVIGEAQGAEVLDLLQAMNSGHEGTLFTVHAIGPEDAMTRLELMATYGSLPIPVATIRQMIASAVDIVTYQERLRDGSRKLLQVAEVMGIRDDAVELRGIFEFRESGIGNDGRIAGDFVATGYVPRCLERIRAVGIDLPVSLFASH